MEPDEYDLMDAAEARMWWYRALHARVTDALLRRPGPGGVVLDAGCGTGGLLARLVPLARPLAGLEFNPAAALRAAAKSGATVAAGDANRLPFADAAFGALTSCDVLCHRAVDPPAALAEFHRVLAPGGTLVLNLPAYNWMHSAHDERVHNSRRFTAGGARALVASAGFAAIEARYWNALLLPLMILQRKVLKSDAAHDSSDVAPFPPWLDATLHGVTAAERALARLGLRYPAGGSILMVATRP
ncbi:class I SAM-dependent methyltransferase [Roseomonas fluvialis]|uniref:SAM-dependent methyltransferase n=1 Tax=Roseomonas fluvialis TaxID=1750527 RepID=A0ABN6P3P8_9PROT|nr:class I SAM-dependent methyltransferase [Roseomonas fluvialis]BDG73091.1 SAM-dependent methyltransferase [Roseomonas fluvialis]